MRLWNQLRSKERDLPLGLNDWAQMMTFGGNNYPYGLMQTNPGQPNHEVGGDYRGLISGAYKCNGIVFACMMVRQLLFSEARFQFRIMEDGRPGEYEGGPQLGPLEKPSPGGTTSELLSRAIQDVDLAGNWFGVRRASRAGSLAGVRRLRPDWVTIVVGSSSIYDDLGSAAPDAEVVGYLYHPNGYGGSGDPIVYRPEEIAHWAPIPDPEASFRGMSWLNPVIDEIIGDQSATTHKAKFFEQGGTPNLVVQFEPGPEMEEVEKWIKRMEEQLGGATNAYRTLYLGGGADAKVVGGNLRQIDFKAVQGAGETRIAAAAGVPPVIVGFSEGLEASTYSNYSQARRRFADGTMRPLWRGMAGALATVIDVPRDRELWYDDRDIPFLKEDQKDAAQVIQVESAAIKGLTEAGYTPESAVEAVKSGDLSRLKHSGMFSVQLQPAGTQMEQPGFGGGSSNGKDPAKTVPTSEGGSE